MSAEPPAWVYDLVIELLEQEELHPVLYAMNSDAYDGYRKYDWCPNVALEKLPKDVVEKAEAIRVYKRSQEAS